MKWELDKAVEYIEEQLPGWHWQIHNIPNHQQEVYVGVWLESPDRKHQVYETSRLSANIAARWAVKRVRGEE
jgi:hypothetical protein